MLPSISIKKDELVSSLGTKDFGYLADLIAISQYEFRVSDRFFYKKPLHELLDL